MKTKEEIRSIAAKKYQTKEAIDSFMDGYTQAQEDYTKAKKFQQEAMESLKERMDNDGYRDSY